MVKVFGEIVIRYQRVAGKPEMWAGFTEDGRQITQFNNNGPIEKDELLPWAETAMHAWARLQKACVKAMGQSEGPHIRGRHELRPKTHRGQKAGLK